MATTSFRNSSLSKGAPKMDTNRSLSLNFAPKPSSFKPKTSAPAPAPGSGPRRNSTGSAATPGKDDAGVSGRVRVAVRLRPRNAEEMEADADFADCVELQPELKRLKLRRNNWDTDTYEFDEVLTEFASQKRVYEVVAKPVVESVLEGYNGTIMAYGQTGTGKTYTLGRLGEENAADRGIMVRAMEDILAELSPQNEAVSVSVSYLQLYMETVQDLLDPSNDNISIVEDPKTGDVSLPGATTIEIRDQKSFVELLRLGEAHRFAANTKLNTESSRSHAILMLHIKRHVKGRGSTIYSENGTSHLAKTLKAPIVRRSKLVVVDLAGSERIDKSGSEAHTLEEAKSINLSLSALGKCINALAENSAHVPVRDSKLTRLLRDSFGVEVPENDGGELLFNNDFLRYCVKMFFVSSRGYDMNSRTFQQKHLNIVDPLKENNNLVHSVSKGNFYRIQSAFTYGARKLKRILLQSDDKIVGELHNFFANTLDRHGSGQRPDVQDLSPIASCNSFCHALPVSEIDSSQFEVNSKTESGSPTDTHGDCTFDPYEY